MKPGAVNLQDGTDGVMSVFSAACAKLVAAMDEAQKAHEEVARLRAESVELHALAVARGVDPEAALKLRGRVDVALSPDSRFL